MSAWLNKIKGNISGRSPEGLLVASFALTIVLGGLLLWLPLSHNGPLGFLQALFTSSSAVCVTGLAVVDTGTKFTVFGQLVILLLIQAGGLGVMSFAALAYQLLRRRMTLRAQAALSSAMLQQDVGNAFAGLFGRIVRFVLLAELIGFVLLFLALWPGHGPGHAAYSALFHSVSAFCNAGFSLYPDSLIRLRDNPLLAATIMALIILGGIGHPVAVDLWQRLTALVHGNDARGARLTLNSRVALVSTGLLLLAGFVLLLIFGMTPAEASWGERINAALFQSVTSRTAGFNTVDMARLAPSSLFVLVMLMFIGGSPASCAGGIKTTTFSLWLAKLWSSLRGQQRTQLFGRYIPDEISRRVSMIIGLSLLWNVLGILLLLETETATAGVGMHDVVFEQISAFGTVGLSSGLTPQLSIFGMIWIMASMFVGRLGPLTLAMWMLTRRAPQIRYPEGRIMIG